MFQPDKRRRPPLRGETARVKLSGEPTGWARRMALDAYPLAIGAALVIATTFLLGAGAQPFPYRLGDRADREIRLSSSLELYNDTKTRNAQEEAVRQSPPVFTHDPQPHVELRARLHNLASAVAKTVSFDMLDPLVRSDWKLTPEAFETLRQVLGTEQDVPSFIDKLDRVFEPILERGVIDPAALPTDRDRETDRIEVFAAGSDTSRFANLDAVLLSELSKPTGPLAQRLDRAWPNSPVSKTLFSLIVPHLRSTLTLDVEKTRAIELRAREQVAPVYDQYAAGYLVVPEGQAITEDRFRLLADEHRRLERNLPLSNRLRHLAGLGLIVTALVAGGSIYIRAYQRDLERRPARLAILAAGSVATLALARLLGAEPYRAEILPIAVACMMFAIAFDRSIALLLAFALSVLVALTQPRPMENFVVVLGGSGVAALFLDSVRSRTKLIVVGFVAGLTYAALSVAMGLLFDAPGSLLLEDAARRFGCGLIAGFLISGSLPFIESMFGIVTDISLIELADSSHPLLQELVRRAPGTYNHSVSVSIIAEAAAQKIGANSLLVRVGALFHDVGKMLKPQYFIENKSPDEKNRHEQLAPALSTLIIIGHVKDGMDLGHQHHLPQPIIDMIEQHHGTTLVDYFFQEAAREQRSLPDPEEAVEESAFRYPGPRPQTKEAAVLMLADCVESASRALSEPTPASIEKLVRHLSFNRLLDGQFNESGLTLEEVELIEDSLTKSLTSVYHGRIKYPAAV